MSAKAELLDLMVRHPKQFSDEDFLTLVHLEGNESVTFDDLRNNIRRIYDMNESSLLRNSDAMQGTLAKMNLSKQKARRKYFFKRMRKGRRTTDHKTVVAEGDSWFCFPFYVKDINHWLIRDPRINLYSIAAAGDWITNMVYEGKYVEELSMIEPDAFLISGGGNDFVGSYRLSFMINTNVDEDLPDDIFIRANVADAFYAFIWTLKTQYWLLLSSLHRADKLQHMKIITQGYDYVIPHPKRIRSADPIQYAINLFTSTGDWLRTPLKLKGLHNPLKQQLLMRHFIDEVNRMFEWLANYPNVEGAHGKPFRFSNLYHVDCRGVAGDLNGWFDEIHLRSDRFRKVAMAYRHIIFEEGEFFKNQKVVRVTSIGSTGRAEPK